MIPAEKDVHTVEALLRADGAPAPGREYRFVRHESVAAYERLGWLNTGPLPGPHGAWSCCLEWVCSCPAPSPRRAP